MSLDFGLLYELPVRGDDPAAERDVFHGAVEQVKIADRVGFTHAWHVEHHFLDEQSHSSNSDTILGAYAAVTEKIRLGFACKLMPHNFNHPLRIAEAVTTLDQLSDGRVDFGCARGTTVPELGGFGVDPAKSKEEQLEAMRMAIGAMTQEEFSWSSDRWEIPPRKLFPRPVQQPHPPVWMAATGPESHAIAGGFQVGLLSFTLMTTLADLKSRTDSYYKAFDESDSPLGRPNRNVATFTQIHCAETDEEARENAREGILFYTRYSIEQLVGMRKWIEGEDVPTFKYLQEMVGIDELEALTFELMDEQDMCIVGSPETCAEKIRRYQEVGCTQMLGIYQIYGMPQEKVKRSIELMGEHVIPQFQDD